MYNIRAENKIWRVDQLVSLMSNKRANRKRVTGNAKTVYFTSGCFDLFHPGHVHFLNECGRLAHADGCHLIVAVNSDGSVKKFKDKQPIMNTAARMFMVSNIYPVDYVVSFSERNPTKLIEYLKPDAILHGDSGEKPSFVDTDELENFKGAVVKLSLYLDWSTTNLVRRIQDKEESKKTELDYEPGVDTSGEEL